VFASGSLGFGVGVWLVLVGCWCRLEVVSVDCQLVFGSLSVVFLSV